MPTMSVWLLALTPEAYRGRAVGGLTTCIFLGQFFSPLVSAPISGAVGLAAMYGLGGAALLILALPFLLGASRGSFTPAPEREPRAIPRG